MGNPTPRPCVDPNRIFAAGHSSGGFFSNTLGCRRGNVLRAIAPVAGGGPFGQCTGEVAYWSAHGANDETVLIATGQASRNGWITRNGRNASSSSPVSPSPCVSYAGCRAGLPVHWCEHPGQHEWPTWAPQGLWSFFTSL